MTTLAVHLTQPADRVADRRPRSLYGNLWLFAAGGRWQLLGAIVLLIASQAIRLALPWFAGQAIDTLQSGGTDAALRAGGWILALLATCLAIWGIHGPGRILERAVGIRVRRSITAALFDRLAHAPLAWHDRHAASDLQQRMGQASGALDDFAQNQYVILQGVVTFVGTLIAITTLSPIIGALAIAGYLLLAVASLRLDRSMMVLAEQENIASRRLSSGLLQFVGGIVTVKALRLQRSVKRQADERLDAVFRPLARSIRLNEAKWCVVDVLSTALTWGIVALYVYQAHRAGTAILVGGIFVIYKYAEQASAVVSAAAGHFQGFAHCRVNFASADLIWNAPPPPRAPVPLDPGWRSIALGQVSFHHARDAGDGSVRRGIEHIDVTLRRGERVALVGPSGCGKSTLMRVMAGLYEPTQGRMTVDGVTHLQIAPLATVATFIPQDADVFDSTVIGNVVPDGVIDDRALERALTVSALREVVDTLPAGLDTPVAERGTNLSGGQRQRVCLARGVYAASHSSLILLDEPTSALDAPTEARIYRELDAHFPDACIVASVHRPSLLGHFDRVVILDEGRLVDEGSVADLATRQPWFAAMLHAAEVPRDEVRTAA